MLKSLVVGFKDSNQRMKAHIDYTEVRPSRILPWYSETMTSLCSLYLKTTRVFREG